MRKHPITGREDPVRANEDWCRRIQELENSLGYVICGAHKSTTGEPCRNRPVKGEHRCKNHLKTPGSRGNPYSEGKRTLPTNISHGVNMDMIMECNACKDDRCGQRIRDPEVKQGDDNCPIELDIREQILALAETYGLDRDNFIDMSILEDIAMLYIKKYRAEKKIAMDGMEVDHLEGFANDGRPITNKNEHHLLQAAMRLQTQIDTKLDSILATPKSKKNKEQQDTEESFKTQVTSILQSAQGLRTGKTVTDDNCGDEGTNSNNS